MSGSCVNLNSFHACTDASLQPKLTLHLHLGKKCFYNGSIIWYRVENALVDNA